MTGGAGFIGSHLCDELVEQGHQVAILDDFSTGSIHNLGRLSGRPEVRVVEGDVREPSAIERAISSLAGNGGQVDIIFHLAAAVGVRTILNHPLESLEVNLKGTENVLRAAAGLHCRVIVASTSEVYGKNDRGALSEDSDRVLGAGDLARWWYAVAKMADEGLALAYHREGRMETLVVRLFNTVGPRQTGRYGMVLPTLVRQALAGEPMTVYGDGEQTRCFTYVADTVRALLLLAQTQSAYGQIFNIGQPEEISINALAGRVREVVGSTSSVVHIPYSEAYGDSFEDMRRRVPDCSRLARTIGFAPSNRLDEAIRAVKSDVEQPTMSGAPAGPARAARS
ncbi:MAG: SDR family NAD(P)-dependent oxidoreductase [Chloroflexota bacterium]